MPRIAGNIFWSVAGQGCWAAGQWGQLSLAAHLGDQELVGRLGLALAVSTPVLMLAGLQLRALQASDASGRFPFALCLALRFGMSAAALAALLVLAAAGGWWSAEARWTLAAVAVWKAVDLVADVAHGRFQQHEDLRDLGMALSLRALASTAAFAATLAAGAGLPAAALAAAGGSLLVLSAFEAPRLRGLGHGLAPRWERTAGAALVRASLPLGAAMMLSSLLFTVPRYALERSHGEGALGVLTAVASFLVLATTLLNAAGQALLPRLARLHHDGQAREFRLLAGALLLGGAAIGGIGALLAWLVGRQALAILFGSAYAAHAGLLTMTMAAAGTWCMASALGYAATASLRHRGQPVALAATLLAVTIAALALVPPLGVAGAVISLGVGGLANLASFAVLLRRPPDPTHGATPP